MNSNLRFSLIQMFLSAALAQADNAHKNHIRYGANVFDQLDQMFQTMEHSMAQMRQTFAHNMNNAGPAIQLSVEEKDKGLLLTINDLETESVDATVNDEEDNLMIKTDQGSLNISIEDHFVGINFNQQKKHEQKNKDGKMETVSTMVGQQSYGMSLANALNLNHDQLRIDYDKEAKTLTLEIPYVMSEAHNNRKTVPVNMKQKAKSEK